MRLICFWGFKKEVESLEDVRIAVNQENLQYFLRAKSAGLVAFGHAHNHPKQKQKLRHTKITHLSTGS